MSRIFGEIAQLGYVVRDIDKALDHWVNVMGVGPFYYAKRFVIETFSYRGKDLKVPFAVAIANSGPLQIELIQPLDDTPSMWNDFLSAGNEGLHHVAFWTTDFDSVLNRALNAGYKIGQQGLISGGRFAYFDAEAHGGTVIELSEQTGPKAGFFKFVREAAADWSGSDPIRTV